VLFEENFHMSILMQQAVPLQSRRAFPGWLHGLLTAGVLISMLSLSVVSGWAQATFGSFVGTVSDASGAVVAACKITVTNVDTAAQRMTQTDASGNYAVLNLEPGRYRILMEAAGFTSEEVTELQLLTQQTVRVDRSLKIATQTQQVDVTEAEGAPISTEASHISETKTGTELIDLPVAIATRASGSTSAFTTLTTQPGVEIDNNNNISVAGLRPAQVSTSIDGLSTQSPFAQGPTAELFPSFDSISEIHINETGNSAEYGSVADITTISKSGTNTFHGSGFDNLMNTDFDARNPFSATVPVLHMNDFGGSLGGPVLKNRMFFFVAYEGLREPSQTVVVESVPSLALRSGDLSVYTTPVGNPFNNGAPFQGNQIPASLISPYSLKVLQDLFPLPNTGTPSSVVNNYVDNLSTPISSNQFDARVDETINAKQSFFARVTYKIQDIDQPTSGTVLAGPYQFDNKFWSFSSGYSYVISPTVLNDLRVGWSGTLVNRTLTGLSGQTVAADIGLTPLLPQPGPSYNVIPAFVISGFQSTAPSNGGIYAQGQRSGVVQALDSVSWIRGAHTLKFGGSFEHMTAYRSNSFQNRYGTYTYNNSVTSSLIGNPYAAFLLGVPDQTALSTDTRDPFDGYSNIFSLYAQDSWKVTPRLTLNYGLRWEYDPIMFDYGSNEANFDPDAYTSVNTPTGPQTVRGVLVVPDQKTLGFVNPDLASSISPVPIEVASQLGLPKTGRYNPTTDFAPRIGFAWRITEDSKNVLRGGYGLYYETLYSGVIQGLFAVEAGYDGFYTNTITNGVPELELTASNPHPFPSERAAPGTNLICDAFEYHYEDPRVQQWNLTYERDLGFQTALRVTYDGNHGSQLGYTPDINQVAPNTVGYAAVAATRPFPELAQVYDISSGARSNYEAFTVSLNKRFSHGLQFETSYNHAVNLDNGMGGSPSSFSSGDSGGTPTNTYDLNYDYGNVPYTRRQRFQTTFLYNLPFTFTSEALNRVAGGWELAGVLLFQTGPFLSVQAAGADPSGTNYENFETDPRADQIAGVPVYAAQKSIYQWVNPAAFAIPANNIGRFGTSQVGSVVGPGTQAVSLSLFKTVQLRERAQLRLGASVANLFNHPNYLPPSLDLGLSNFNTISNVQSADAGGPRQMMLSARITF
jgi:hypothetical protein